MSTETTLAALNRLLGSWTTEATHPAMPGVVVQGSVEMTWLEGERFLIHRATTEHPDFPDSISILGMMGKDRVTGPRDTGSEADGEPRLRMHYFDSRGVFRVYDASIDDIAWRLWRDAKGFSQRFSGRVEDGGNTIVGRWEVSEDDVHWTNDLEITYRRRPKT
jgi:hypothetical protein